MGQHVNFNAAQGLSFIGTPKKSVKAGEVSSIKQPLPLVNAKTKEVGDELLNTYSFAGLNIHKQEGVQATERYMNNIIKAGDDFKSFGAGNWKLDTKFADEQLTSYGKVLSHYQEGMKHTAGIEETISEFFA